MEEGSVSGDVSDVAAGLLEAEKRKLAENQTRFQADFESREARFNADLEAVAPQKPKGPARSIAADIWLLARKRWAWMYRD
jgi:hypothetical protein